MLQVTFADQLGSAAHSNATAQEQEVASKQEAKRLAFYLFWNVKPYFDRWGFQPLWGNLSPASYKHLSSNRKFHNIPLCRHFLASRSHAMVDPFISVLHKEQDNHCSPNHGYKLGKSQDSNALGFKDGPHTGCSCTPHVTCCMSITQQWLWVRRNHILLEDIKQFLPPNKAAHAFEILDSDSDGKISLHDIRDSILQIYKVAFRIPQSFSLGVQI